MADRHERLTASEHHDIADETPQPGNSAWGWRLAAGWRTARTLDESLSQAHSQLQPHAINHSRNYHARAQQRSIGEQLCRPRHVRRPLRGTGAPGHRQPKARFVAVPDQVKSPFLDAGCGTGENSPYFASNGHRVIGIDFVAEAIRRARRQAAELNASVEFLIKDALALGDWDARFNTVIDSGLFHFFSNADRQRYVRGLTKVLEPGGRLFLLCFSDREPGTDGPRRVSRQ
jgi:SAM-dependent methyltransferase